MRSTTLLIVGVVGGTLLLIGGLALVGARPRKPIADVMTACVQHAGIGIHTHARLNIQIDGQEKDIPADIGVTDACMRPLHTHKDDHEIHMEFPVVQDVRLGQFFQVWGQPFSKQRILDRTIGTTDRVQVTVNGTEVSQLEDLPLHDRDEIVVEVTSQDQPEAGAEGS